MISIKKIIFISLCLTVIPKLALAICIPVDNYCPANCTTYRCNAGYFGDGYTCTSCATATGNANATSAKGSTLITHCYIPNGGTGSNSTGNWSIVGGSCPYVS